MKYTIQLACDQQSNQHLEINKENCRFALAFISKCSILGMKLNAQFQKVKMENEILGLRSYVTALELENRSKSLEQEVLHRELETLNAQLSEMQQYYFQNRELVKEVEALHSLLNAKDAEIAELSIKLLESSKNAQKYVEVETLLKEHEKTSENLKQNLQQVLKREKDMQQILDSEKTMLAEQKESNEDLRRLLQSKEIQLNEIKMKLNNTVNNQSEFPTLDNGQHLLALRIEELEEEGEEREDKMKEMGDYIEELQYCCQSLSNKLKAKDIELRQLRVEASYLQKQLKLITPIPKKSGNCFHRSQVATPRWKDSQVPQSRSISPHVVPLQSQKQNYSLRIRSLSQCSQSQSGSFSVNQQTNRLQKRNNILKMQNEMLLRNMTG